MNLRDVPSMIILFILYNLLALIGAAGALDVSPLFHLPMVSGAKVPVTGGAILTIIALFFLHFEVLKSTRAEEQMLEQTLSMGLFVIFLVEFLLVQAAGTTTFFMLTVIQLIDVMAGFTVAVASKRAGLQVGR